MSVASDLADQLGHDMTRGTEMRDAVDRIGRSYRRVDIGDQAHCINVFADGSSIVVVTHRDGRLTWFSADSEARAAVSSTGAELSRLRVERDRLAGTVAVREREIAEISRRQAALEKALTQAIADLDDSAHALAERGHDQDALKAWKRADRARALFAKEARHG